MKIADYKTAFTYDVGAGYFVEIVITPDKVFEAWMFHERYGVKSLMFGAESDKFDIGEFLEIVEANIEDDRQYYYEEYIKED